jgi:hypothetical protein
MDIELTVENYDQPLGGIHFRASAGSMRNAHVFVSVADVLETASLPEIVDEAFRRATVRAEQMLVEHEARIAADLPLAEKVEALAELAREAPSRVVRRERDGEPDAPRVSR